jgi:CRP-like cAMP-binding protein
MLRRQVHDCSDCELRHDGTCAFAPKKLKADEVLTTQGTLASEVAFVRSGVVALSAVNPSGEQTWGAVRGPRSLLGVEALAGATSSCEVRALTALECCSATVSTVKFMLGSAGGARTLFGLTLTEVLEQRRDIDFRTGTAEARVARFALACERLIGRDKSQPLSKARVAALVGIRPETLSRVLRRFSDQGLLDASKGICVLDRRGLETLAGRDE